MKLLVLTENKVTVGLFFQSTISLHILLSFWQTPHFIFQGWIIRLAFDFCEKSILFQLGWSSTAKSSLTWTLSYTKWHTSFVRFFQQFPSENKIYPSIIVLHKLFSDFLSKSVAFGSICSDRVYNHGLNIIFLTMFPSMNVNCSPQFNWEMTQELKFFKGNKMILKNPKNFRNSSTTLLAGQASFCVSQVFQFQSLGEMKDLWGTERAIDDRKFPCTWGWETPFPKSSYRKLNLSSSFIGDQKDFHWNTHLILLSVHHLTKYNNWSNGKVP